MIDPVKGIVPATVLPLRADFSIDAEELERLVAWIAEHPGVGAIATNGIAGEVFALSAEERARVTAIAASALGGAMPVISGIYCENADDAVDHARRAKLAGATALLVMPPARWMRYGMAAEHVVQYFSAIGRATELLLIAHVYPAWTKASYSPELLGRLARLPWVKTFKVGTREMSKYELALRQIRAASADATILTCQDEFLLPSMVQGVDGALVGFASFVPERITALFDAVQANDLAKARKVYDALNPLKELVYGESHPSYENYPRMKTAMMMTGRLAFDYARPPIEPRSAAALAEIASLLAEAGFDVKSATPRLATG